MYRERLRHGLRATAAALPLRAAAPGLLVAALVAGCAVGPDFEPPAAPGVPRYTVAPLADATASADTDGGAAQRFAAGRDIPGEWWTLFRSRHLNRMIELAIADHGNLEAAHATLRP